jgi:hypothetical protein
MVQRCQLLEAELEVSKATVLQLLSEVSEVAEGRPSSPHSQGVERLCSPRGFALQCWCEVGVALPS